MSLKIEKIAGSADTIRLEGRLDTSTAPELERELDALLESTDTKELVIDMGGLEYISSAGLRLVLKAQKAMSKKGSLKLVHVPESVMEVFEITGFADFLTIEK